MRGKITAILFGVLLAIAGGVIAQSGGFPSRPRFQSVGVGVAAPAGAGDITATARATANEFRALGGGFFTGASGPGLELSAPSGTATIVGYDRTAAAYVPLVLAGSTVGLTSNVGAITLSSPGSLGVNTSPGTGSTNIAFTDDGTVRGYIGFANLAGNPCGGQAIGDFCIRLNGAGKQVGISYDNGTTFTTLQRSAISTKHAAAWFTGATGAVGGANNGGVTSGSRNSTGNYDVNIAAAGFTQRPSCTCTAYHAQGICIVNDPSSATTFRVQTFGFTATPTITVADVDYMLSCSGI
jgi:hypothetical protein